MFMSKGINNIYRAAARKKPTREYSCLKKKVGTYKERKELVERLVVVEYSTTITIDNTEMIKKHIQYME